MSNGIRLKNIRVERDETGVPHIIADSKQDAVYGLGYIHAADRGLQMLMMRILGQGRASECLDSNEELLHADLFFRKMNWKCVTSEQIGLLSSEAKELCQAYCDGANAHFSKKIPWELKYLCRYRQEPWSVEDIILLVRMAGYIGLAQSQGELERLLIELVQKNIGRDLLEELFPNQLNELDTELIRKIKLHESIVPAELRWISALPRMMASNNWVVSGSRTKSGKPHLANDPHLEVNRLPNIWSEVVLELPEQCIMGATMPGLPAVLIGRNDSLAWGVTYTFMDAMDSWIEECRNQKHRRGEEWKNFTERKERILRKKKPALEKTFYETDCGILDGQPHDGYCLATRWSAQNAGPASLNAAFQMFDAQNVSEGMDLLGRLELSFNWVLADDQNNIGYQMSGLMPKRKKGVSGLVPLPAWDASNHWKGFVTPSDLPRILNPKEGFFVTANNGELNDYGVESPINSPMGSYRADRIRQLLAETERLEIEDHFRIQHDLHSLQAVAFMKMIGPLLPKTPEARRLQQWDGNYDLDSQEAVLFENIYRSIFRRVFGAAFWGADVHTHLQNETGIFAEFYLNFDRILLSEKSAWFQGRSRDDIYREAIAEGMRLEPPTHWAQKQLVRMNHFLLGGKLPLWLGFDKGPLAVAGGRGSISQGQIFRAGGRTTSFVPSFRMVTDLHEKDLRTNLAGGPSDRRFSRWYTSDLKNWQLGIYKSIRRKSPEY